MSLYINNCNVRIVQTPVGIKVLDGNITLRTSIKKGIVTYTRTSAGGVLFIDGVKVAEHTSAIRSTCTEGSIYGNGQVKNMKVWAESITESQCSILT